MKVKIIRGALPHLSSTNAVLVKRDLPKPPSLTPGHPRPSIQEREECRSLNKMISATALLKRRKVRHLEITMMRVIIYKEEEFKSFCKELNIQ